MRPLLKVNGDNASKKLPLSVIGSKKYKIHVLFWSHEPDGSKPPEKAAALIFSFSDRDGQPVAAPERLHRTISGEAFRYINLSDTPIMTFDIAVPRSAVTMELEIRSWNHKKFSAEITRLELMEPSSVVDASRDQSIYFPNDLAFTSVPPREMHMRYFLEATLAEQARPKAKFSETKNSLPAVADLRLDEKFSLAIDYASRHGDRTARPRHLVVCTSYPTAQQVEASAFVHARVKAYIAAGVEVDILSFSRQNRPTISRFDGVDTLFGYANELMALLTIGEYDSISIHFLHPHMWGTISNFFQQHRFHLFLHGHGARNWSRVFDPAGGYEALRGAKSASDLYLDMWQTLMREADLPESFIFVSEWMRKCAEDDMHVSFPESRCHVINNPINTDIFKYHEKPKDHAKRILMIRNFDKFQYGTDIALRCIEELQRRSVWKDLSFSIYGQGHNLSALKERFVDEPNVAVHERFLSAREIAAAHRDHGIMLIPTRWDSQGVSRDEAMASGLVPATNAVCAIPEFVDESCAILAEGEDHLALADGIERLATSPQIFLQMSARAAEKVRNRSRYADTIGRELTVLGIAPR